MIYGQSRVHAVRGGGLWCEFGEGGVDVMFRKWVNQRN